MSWDATAGPAVCSPYGAIFASVGLALRLKNRKSYISFGRFFLIYLLLFEIRANHLIHWISTTLIIFLLLPHPAPPPPPPDPPAARAAPPAAAAPARCARAAAARLLPRTAAAAPAACLLPRAAVRAAAGRVLCCCARAVAATPAAARCGCYSCRCRRRKNGKLAGEEICSIFLF